MHRVQLCNGTGKLRWFDGLGDVRIKSLGDRTFGVLRASERGHRRGWDADSSDRSYMAYERVPIAVGNADVAQEDVGSRSLDLVQCEVRRPDDDDARSSSLQRNAHELLGVDIVFHDEHTHTDENGFLGGRPPFRACEIEEAAARGSVTVIVAPSFGPALSAATVPE